MDTLENNELQKRLGLWDEMNCAIRSLCEKNFPAQIQGLSGSLPSFFLRSLFGKKNFRTLIAIVPTEKDEIEISQDLRAAFPKAKIFRFPWWAMIPYRAAGKGSSVFGERAAFLSKLLQEKDVAAGEEICDNAAKGENIASKAASKNAKICDKADGLLGNTAGEKICDKAAGPANAAALALPRIFIASERAFLSPLPDPAFFKKFAIRLKKGQGVDTQSLSESLSKIGYTRVPKVSVPGEFALRGEVLDVFLPLEEDAFRVTLDFEKIEKIKTFSSETQATTGEEEEIFIPPLKEVLFDKESVETLRKNLENISSCAENHIKHMKNHSTSETFEGAGSSAARSSADGFFADGCELEDFSFSKKAKEVLEERLLELEIEGSSSGEELLYPALFEKRFSLLDYAAPDALAAYFDFDRQKNAAKAFFREFCAMFEKARAEEPVLPPFFMMMDFETLFLRHGNSIFFRSLKTDADGENIASTENIANGGVFQSQVVRLFSESSQSFFGNINFLKERLSDLKSQGFFVFIFADNENQSQRISQILGEEILSQEGEGKIFVVPKSISKGFSVPNAKIFAIQENEIFGRRKKTPKSLRTAKSQVLDTFVDLNPGDFVVHANYGIGLFKGIERVKAAGQERDYIKLEYAEGDIAFVPIEQANLVQRYIGNEGNSPRLDRIGSKAWENRKNRVKKAVEELAQKLIDLYSRRKIAQGLAFPKDTEWQAAFEAAFPYEDTPDQIAVTEEVKADMERDVPMDRLLCGDVGYGKTEIAMRAAFKAVLGGKQVAFLAPTTILAEQHYETCLERFKNFPVSIQVLSRFVPPPRQKKILCDLKAGSVDILIGTHRIIQNDVKFKNLGLIIIDEEQRFGVKDKEKFKEIKNNIDCLSMSATPIPRTLHMSFLKIRDMSLLKTPPQNRQAIETVIDPYSDLRVAKAIRSEVERGGQVFFLHNRVETLEEVRRHLEKIVPEMIIDIAHGRMSSEELDDIFRRFKNGGFHVLLSTTIIENGIDIPNVNTIIIDRADMYGVSQLYQLRGRVGRSDRKAYAYLLYPEKKSLSEIAMKRLQVISDFTALGSGFKIAMKDMEIRGAGNLLGRDQSGHVYSVGFDMYLRLLNEAVERLTAQKEYVPQSEVLLELEYTGFIPDSYVQNQEAKMEIYKKIAAVSNLEELEAVKEELFDRFGPVPKEAESLLTLSEIRIIADSLFVTSIKEKSGEAKIEFGKVSGIKIENLLALIKEMPDAIRLDPSCANVVIMKTGGVGLKEKGAFLSKMLGRLSER